MDKYQDVRSIPLKSVLASLGFTDFKKRAGKQEWYGRCPFHDPKKNKTSFSFDERRFNCFSCGEHGSGSIDLVIKLKKIGFQETVNFLGGAITNSHRRVRDDSVYASPGAKKTTQETETQVLVNKPFAGTYEKFYVKSEWLKARGLSEENLKLYGVGQYFNPSRKSAYSNKILFPIRRFSDGAKVGYLARTIDEKSAEPKYIFPKGFHKQLEVFGAWQLKQLMQKGLTLPLRQGFVVESPLCVMKYWQLGLYAVSPFGAFVSEQQVEIIRSLFRGVVYLPDRDKYPKVADTVWHLSQSLWVKAPQLPLGIDDPEYLSPEQIALLVKS
jgi:DNA primase